MMSTTNTPVASTLKCSYRRNETVSDPCGVDAVYHVWFADSNGLYTSYCRVHTWMAIQSHVSEVIQVTRIP